MKKYLYPSYITQVIEALKKLPGVGAKSAERYAFDLLNWREEDLNRFLNSLKTLRDESRFCSECGALVERSCSYCTESRQSSGTLCVTTSAKEIFMIEETGEFMGLYHVLEGKLSPLEGATAEDLGILSLKKRIEKYQIKEVIIAIDSTVEGDATTLLLKQELADAGARMTRLAFGLPMGSSLEYVDGNTLTLALLDRKHL